MQNGFATGMGYRAFYGASPVVKKKSIMNFKELPYSTTTISAVEVSVGGFNMKIKRVKKGGRVQIRINCAAVCTAASQGITFRLYRNGKYTNHARSTFFRSAYGSTWFQQQVIFTDTPDIKGDVEYEVKVLGSGLLYVSNTAGGFSDIGKSYMRVKDIYDE